MSTTAIESPSKRVKVGHKTIGTHDGTFHCDEALAVFMLRKTSTYAGATVVRTRDLALLDQQDIVVDVGAIYDSGLHRYDHHQRGFTEVFGHGFNTKLSSAGLVYKHFGKEIVASHLGYIDSDPRIEQVWLKLYEDFVEAIDGVDNGVTQYPTDVAPLYRNRTDLSSRVGWLNPVWNQPTSSTILNAQFEKASALAGGEFISRLDYIGNAWLPARKLVENAVNERFKYDKSGGIIVFHDFAPWKEHLFNIESSLSIPTSEQPIYVLYPDEKAQWRIQAVPVSSESFQSRKALPEAWRGVRDDELSTKTGIPGCIFVHAAGFIGGNRTLEGALGMARGGLKI
uniref:Metal-dependent protein hydrolase n=1 Tax=Bartheletia paradoxa TaxID=669517 RepID=A0A2D0XI03_9BASI|nr:hypothetical protein SPAR05040 [Bartheletia paradoxa]